MRTAAAWHAILLLFAGLLSCAAQQPSATVAAVRSAGVLRCGVVREDAEYSTEDDHGSRGTFDEDLCRAFAVAVLDTRAAVKIDVFLDEDSAVKALRERRIEVIPTLSTSPSDPAPPNLHFSPTVFHDGVGFLVPAAAKIERARQLSGRKICFLAETSTEVSVRAWFEAQHLDLLPFPFQEEGEMEAAYITNNCMGLAGDVTRLARTKLNFGSLADNYVLIPETISNDPLAAATRADDPQWSKVIAQVLDILLEAEEQDMTAAAASSLAPTSSMAVKFNGLADIAGLAPGWPLRVVAATASYGEIYDRAFGPRSTQPLLRGPNALVRDGGRMQSQAHR